jgi:hypothetical protein
LGNHDRRRLKKSTTPLLFSDRSYIKADMANLSSVFHDALADQAKAALVSIVANNPKTTVRDLKDLIADNPALGGLTLSELLGASAAPVRGRPGRKPGAAAAAAAAKPAKPAAVAKPAAPATGGARKGGKRNVRTEAGRDAFDTEVLEALKAHGGDNVSATSLRETIGAEPTQLRTALNRLIERGLVTFSGKARGTRYSTV